MAYDEFDDALEEGPTGPRFPTVKLEDKGQQWVGMLIDYDDKAPLYEFGTQTRATFEGKERTQDLLTVLLLPKTDCLVLMPREPGDDRGQKAQAEPGLVAQVYIQGHNRYDPARPTSFRKAKERFGRFMLGDVVLGRLDDLTKDGAGGRQLSQEKKVVAFEMRKPRPEEAAFVERCRQERHTLKAAASQPETVPASTPTAPVPDDGEPW